jgi:Asp-tRNA(Asn)/Glu-tRNA(Gln) amidotransferase A subunit family amidase
MIAFASSLDQAGVIARSAEDCALLLAAMAGFDSRDSTSLQAPVADYVAACARPVTAAGSESAPLAGMRIGLPREFFGEGLASDVCEAVEAGIAALCKLGAVAVPVSLPRTELSIPAYYVIAPAEASSNLSRFDGFAQQVDEFVWRECSSGAAVEHHLPQMTHIRLVTTQVDGCRQRHGHQRRVLAGVEHHNEIRVGVRDQRYTRAAPQSLQTTRERACAFAQFTVREDGGQFTATIVVIEAGQAARGVVKRLRQRGELRWAELDPAGGRCRHIL